MIGLDAFDSHILIDVPGCPGPVVEHAVLWAAIQFARGSLILTYDADPITLRPGDAEYEIELKDEGTKVEQIISASLDGRDLLPLHRDNRPRSASYVHAYDFIGDNTIRLFGTPTAAGTLSLEIAVAPAEDATQLPDELIRHQLAIAYGAKSRLFLMPNMPWTNAQLAVANAGLFRAGINDAQLQANRRRTRAPARIQFRPLA